MALASAGHISFTGSSPAAGLCSCSSFSETSQVTAGECLIIGKSSVRASHWTSQSASRRSVQCNGIFSDLKGNLLSKFKGGKRESGTRKQPPIWPPPEDADESDQEDVTDEDVAPYVPEVNKDAELDESVLKEIASKGATEVRVVDVDKVFLTSQGEKKVVRGVSLRVEAGQLVALVGPSGSGKTTLLRMIAGLEPTSAGKVYFNDEDLTNVCVQDRDVGFMFQSYALFKHMTVAANVAYGLSTSKRKGTLTPGQIKKRVDDLLSLVQLSEYGERYPPQLSGGQRQRVALARALATEPRLLLLDEPFGALDVVVRQELRTWVKKLQKALNITTIFVTHDQDEALEMADYMVVFHRGRILQEGPPFEVYERPNSAFVMNFISDPNVIPATCLAVRRSGFRTTKPYVLVRPDDLTIFYEEKLDLPTTPATVIEVNNMGPEVLCEIKYDDDVTLEFNRQRYDFEEQPLEVGQRVHLQLKPLLLKAFSEEDLKA
ncbi:hypothetical protein R1flu_000063 [Riccia fluitans]|uniref:ABC transporter domain-containing protein n=1 Tax=Riccia fluitans TaxID=41844 RepID=A0ABD1XZD0_9MARC